MIHRASRARCATSAVLHKWISVVLLSLLCSFPFLLVLVAALIGAGDVCSVLCDKRDPSTAKQDTFPVPNKTQNGRIISLHLSEADAMAWGSFDKGTPRDEIWLDRTWDGGSNWDSKIGKASTRTLMYNLADPSHNRRGMIRACGNSGGIQCTDWVRAAVCDVGCDGETNNQGDSQPVGSKTVSGRTIVLHVDDRGMFWGTISGGAPGDEIWLDRSWNEGKNWDGGSSLGRTSTPSGATSTRTVLFAARDPKLLLYGGAVRACGRAVTGVGGACTSWARPAADRAAAAADALMWAYQPDTAWWLSSWWNSAVSITTLMDWMWVTGRRDYIWAVDRTFEVKKLHLSAGARTGDGKLLGNFTSRAIDDSAWWGMAWVRAYDLTGDKKYLDMAVFIAEYVHGYWDTSTCNGGVWWDGERTYKNAVTVGLYIRLTAVLHNRISGDTTWRDRAITAWNWFDKSGMVNSDGLVNDGINHACKNNGQRVYSYNQGLAIGGALEVYRITGNASTLDSAKRLADAAMNSSVLTVDGVLTEACDAPNQVCNDNGKQFKGIFMRYFGDLANATRVDKYIAYVHKQADTVWSKDRDSLNRLGQRWNGVDNADFPNARDWRTQASAMGALVVAIGL